VPSRHHVIGVGAKHLPNQIDSRGQLGTRVGDKFVKATDFPQPRNGPRRVLRKPSSRRVELRAGLNHLAHDQLDLGSSLRTLLAIRIFGLRAFESRQRLLNVGQSGLERLAAVLRSTQRDLCAIDLCVITVERRLFGGSCMTRHRLFELVKPPFSRCVAIVSVNAQSGVVTSYGDNLQRVKGLGSPLDAIRVHRDIYFPSRRECRLF